MNLEQNIIDVDLIISNYYTQLPARATEAKIATEIQIMTTTFMLKCRILLWQLVFSYIYMKPELSFEILILHKGIHAMPSFISTKIFYELNVESWRKSNSSNALNFTFQ